ncbi:phospholipase A and acyltransferase 1-like isoform X3 [Pyrgilauda ruficollis]|uniref:phospholipase A and acyltransferase 1-like isoform X3 n=1 Tax=Pyrgilauda ruficollis TaxID=221976 RepID=UPI001B8611D7|nr:phospholipase A and acyltransferase 1-like isoform X3 [Pyrgilauda ruficollis]
MAEGRRDPQPGDLIEIDRPLYQHWALYLGDGYVIHVTDERASSVWLSSSSIRATRAKVKKDPLEEVVKNHKWRVNNKYDRSRTPRPVEEIIRRAELCIDREVPYNVLNSNCEHFVTMLRYGEGESEQVQKAAAGSAAAAVGSIILGVAAFVGMALSESASRR